VITREISDQPVQTVITQQPVQTVQTTETVRTVRPAPRSKVRRQVITTRRTTVSERVVPTQTVTTPSTVDMAVAASPRLLYEGAPPYNEAPLYGYNQGYNQPPLYDTVAAPSSIDETVVNAPLAPATAIPTYRYVYEPDRILVIDPATGIAVRALPR
jgi:hypothetical protein